MQHTMEVDVGVLKGSCLCDAVAMLFQSALRRSQIITTRFTFCQHRKQFLIAH